MTIPSPLPPVASETQDGISPGGVSDLETGRLWLALVEQGTRCDLLERQVQAMERSKSWQITAPLRALVRRLDRWRKRKPERPALSKSPLSPRDAAPQARVPGWLARFTPVAGDIRPRLLVDVTELALEDLGAGVQRVTRRVLSELLLVPPTGHAVTPVRLTSDGRYCIAREFLAAFLGLPEGALGQDGLLQPRAGDRFLGLDFCRDHADELAPALAALREAGVPITLTVPDLLPITNPDWFPHGISAACEKWLRVLSGGADRALCISRDCESNLHAALAALRLPLPHEGAATMR